MSSTAFLTTGAIFGVALTASGIYTPESIISQLRLTDFQMLKVFLTAAATSSILVYFKKLSKPTYDPARKPSSLGLVGRYDGNIIGGAMQGFGMALTGACPGTVLVQIATGISSGWAVLLGGVLAGTVWSNWGHLVKRPQPVSTAKSNESKASEKFDSVDPVGPLAFTAACLAAVFAASVLSPGGMHGELNPVYGGLLVAAAQVTSLIFTQGLMGVSTAYEDIGRWFWAWVSHLPGSSSKEGVRKPWPTTKSISFMIGILAGAFAFSQTGFFHPSSTTLTSPPPSSTRAIIGGASLIFGSRIAGGCTSGHGISGMATLSSASFITMASMFAGGVGLALLLGGI